MEPSPSTPGCHGPYAWGQEVATTNVDRSARHAGCLPHRRQQAPFTPVRGGDHWAPDNPETASTPDAVLARRTEVKGDRGPSPHVPYCRPPERGGYGCRSSGKSDVPRLVRRSVSAGRPVMRLCPRFVTIRVRSPGSRGGTGRRRHRRGLCSGWRGDFSCAGCGARPSRQGDGELVARQQW